MAISSLNPSHFSFSVVSLIKITSTVFFVRQIDFKLRNQQLNGYSV